MTLFLGNLVKMKKQDNPRKSGEVQEIRNNH